MNYSGEAAESIVRMSFQGLEFALKITGSGAKNIAAMLYAVAKDQKKMKGKTSMMKLLKSGKELKVFSIKKDDLKKFVKEAKRYGVLFHAIVDKKGAKTDGMVDLIVRAEDASKINRIVDRFNMATVDTATIRNEVEKSKEKLEADKGVETKTAEEKLVDEILSKPIDKEENTDSNPTMEAIEKNHLSEPSSTNKKDSSQDIDTRKPSVREEIKKIKEEQKENNDLNEKTKPDMENMEQNNIRQNERKKKKKQKKGKEK